MDASPAGRAFPKAPVGAVAKWTIDRGLEQDGISAQEVFRCEITKLQKQLVNVETSVRQRATPQTFRAPESKVEVELSRFAAEGTGEITWDPTRLVPRSAKTTVIETKHIGYKVEGQPVTATVVTRRSLTIPSD